MDWLHIAITAALATTYALGAVVVAEREPPRVAIFWPFVVIYALVRGFIFDDPRDL